MYLRPVSMSRVNPVEIRSVRRPQTAPEPSTSFSNALQSASTELRGLDKEVLASQAELLMGNARDMHTATLAAEKASLALDLVISVRNKAIEAYQEIMRMPV